MPIFKLCMSFKARSSEEQEVHSCRIGDKAAGWNMAENINRENKSAVRIQAS